MAKVSERPIFTGDPSVGYVVMDIPTVNGNRIRRVAPNKIGARGPAGPQGAQGVEGVQGVQGPPGPNGADGLDGADGADATPGGSATEVQFNDGGTPNVLGGDANFTWDKTNDELTVGGNVRVGVEVLSYGANTTLDFRGKAIQLMSVTGGLTLDGTNYAAGRQITLILTDDGSGNALNLDANWTVVGAAAPANLTASKKSVLTLTSTTGAATGVIAAFAEEA